MGPFTQHQPPFKGNHFHTGNDPKATMDNIKTADGTANVGGAETKSTMNGFSNDIFGAKQPSFATDKGGPFGSGFQSKKVATNPFTPETVDSPKKESKTFPDAPFLFPSQDRSSTKFTGPDPKTTKPKENPSAFVNNSATKENNEKSSSGPPSPVVTPKSTAASTPSSYHKTASKPLFTPTNVNKADFKSFKSSKDGSSNKQSKSRRGGPTEDLSAYKNLTVDEILQMFKEAAEEDAGKFSKEATKIVDNDMAIRKAERQLTGIVKETQTLQLRQEEFLMTLAKIGCLQKELNNTLEVLESYVDQMFEACCLVVPSDADKDRELVFAYAEDAEKRLHFLDAELSELVSKYLPGDLGQNLRKINEVLSELEIKKLVLDKDIKMIKKKLDE